MSNCRSPELWRGRSDSVSVERSLDSGRTVRIGGTNGADEARDGTEGERLGARRQAEELPVSVCGEHIIYDDREVYFDTRLCGSCSAGCDKMKDE